MSESKPDNEADAILAVCDDRITPTQRQDVAWGLYISHWQAYSLAGDDDYESALWWLGRYLRAGGEIERKT